MALPHGFFPVTRLHRYLPVLKSAGMWTRCELELWALDGALYAVPCGESCEARTQREWARSLGASPTPAVLPAGAPVTDIRRPTGGLLARCTVDDIDVFMSAALIDDGDAN